MNLGARKRFTATPPIEVGCKLRVRTLGNVGFGLRGRDNGRHIGALLFEVGDAFEGCCELLLQCRDAGGEGSMPSAEMRKLVMRCYTAKYTIPLGEMRTLTGTPMFDDHPTDWYNAQLTRHRCRAVSSYCCS